MFRGWHALALVALFLGAGAPLAGAGPLATSGGAIVLTFDDGCVSMPFVADELEARGMRGTFYVEGGTPSVLNDCAFMSLAQIAALGARGHDVEAHTLTHPDLTRLSLEDVQREVAGSQAVLTDLLGRRVSHFAYPYGATNAGVTAEVASVFRTGRLYYASYAAMPLDLPDAHLLSSVGVLSTTTPEDVAGWIQTARSRNVALVLTFHDIAADPEPYETTPARLRAILDVVARSGVPVRTMDELFGGGARVSFAPRNGNGWWAQVALSGPDAGRIAHVESRDDGGSWVRLARTSWGDHAGSYRIEPGHRVAYKVTLTDGRSVESCAFAHPEPRCAGALGGASTGGAVPSASPTFAASFRNVRGNAWWVEADVTASGGTLAGVDARVEGGTWVPLALRSYGSWARSIHVPSGADVELRARSTAGATATSVAYAWPPS